MDKEKDLVLVTGVARGLGKEIVISLLKDGFDVIGVDINDYSYHERIRDHQDRFLFIKEDITDVSGIARIKNEALKRKKTIDVLINNAGRMISEKLGHSSIEKWHQILQLNLTAPFMLVNAFTCEMNEFARFPLVVNVASISGLAGGPYCASYVCSKHGLVGLTEAINEEFRIHGRIRSVAICSGPLDTPAQQDLGFVAGISPRPDENLIDPAMLAGLITQTVRLRENMTVTRLVVRPR
ncbi:MAG: SDR family oxidoreductase [Nitrospirae bacterium]|nr:SDR family oxidoreductase [Nitrospirota bacterium]